MAGQWAEFDVNVQVSFALAIACHHGVMCRLLDWTKAICTCNYRLHDAGEEMIGIVTKRNGHDDFECHLCLDRFNLQSRDRSNIKGSILSIRQHAASQAHQKNLQVLANPSKLLKDFTNVKSSCSNILLRHSSPLASCTCGWQESCTLSNNMHSTCRWQESHTLMPSAS